MLMSSMDSWVDLVVREVRMDTKLRLSRKGEAAERICLFYLYLFIFHGVFKQKQQKDAPHTLARHLTATLSIAFRLGDIISLDGA